MVLYNLCTSGFHLASRNSASKAKQNGREIRRTRGPNLLLFGYWRGQEPDPESTRLPLPLASEHLAAPICIQLNRLS